MGKTMFEKERKEHPSFTAKQIRKIVTDHKATRNRMVEVNQALKRKFLVLTLILPLLLVSFLLMRNETLIVYAADSYGNDINFVEVWQYNGTAWNLLANFTSTGGSVRVHDGWATNFTVGIKMNSTLVSSTSDAIAYTRVYMNITDGGTIWNNVELNNTACSLNGDYYYLTEQGHWNATGEPVAGVTYACSILYQAYY